MPYTRDHLLLRFGGTAASQQETWSCGVRLATADPASGADLLTLAQDGIAVIAPVVQSYVGSLDSDFNNLCRLEWVKLNPIAAATGDYLFPNDPVELLFESPFTQGASTVAAPLQIAYVVTMRGEFRRGPAAFGRWYVPAGDPGVTTTGVMSATVAQQKANAAGTFLEGIQALNLGDPGASLRVRLFGDGVGGTRESRVVSVEVGNVFDTQRRRRRQIDETYFAATTWVEPTP